MNPIQNRSIPMVYVLIIVTFGIYALVWLVKTKEEINSIGGSIPTAWLIIIPIANFWWVWRYCEDFGKFVKKDDNGILWFLLYIFAGIIMPAIVQSELNKLAAGNFEAGMKI